jgi:hypothetical protein
VPDADLATLADHAGELVRIGGLVVARTPGGFTLDDGTAIGRVALRGEAAAFIELIDAGDAIGVVGRVEAGAGKAPLVITTDPAGLVRLGSLGEAVPLAAEVAPSATPGPSGGSVAEAGLGDPMPGPDGGWLGALGLLVASFGSLLATVARRRRAHLRLRMAVVRRIGELRSSPDPTRAPFDRA